VGTISRLKLYLISFAILVALIVIPLLGFLITLDDNASGSKKVQSEDFKTIEKRIKEFTAHLKNNPEDGLAFKRLGELYLKAGRLSEAVSTYVAAEKILPKDPEIRKAFIQLQSMGHATSNR
jgi:cytochrome c-type biogenesis protein CcmH/NrfG|tara:strand:- start:468 stop:833 length:366 start_codon:yes stop_codon:yes gene_type:complete